MLKYSKDPHLHYFSVLQGRPEHKFRHLAGPLRLLPGKDSSAPDLSRLFLAQSLGALVDATLARLILNFRFGHMHHNARIILISP